MHDETNILQELAEQLSCPTGDKGIQLAYQMNISNISVTLNGIHNLYLNDNDKVLELGHGNAGHLTYLIAQAKHIHYTGLEVSPTMYSEAIALNKAFIDADLASFAHYDGLDIPFPAYTFDKILSVNTIYFWSDAKTLLHSIYQVLKTNGLFCLTFCDKSFMQSLPFIQYGFQLYDPVDIMQLTTDLPLELVYQDRKQDKSISKSGQLVDRIFYSLVFRKYT